MSMTGSPRYKLRYVCTWFNDTEEISNWYLGNKIEEKMKKKKKEEEKSGKRESVGIRTRKLYFTRIVD